jgi:hypothetical protein
VILPRDKETLINYGYSLDRKPMDYNTASAGPDWEYLAQVVTAYGKFHYSGYGGIVYAFDTKDGSIL